MTTRIAANWGWFVALGVGIIVRVRLPGSMSPRSPPRAWLSLARLLAAGMLYILHAFRNRTWQGFVSDLLFGILSFVGGLLMINEPVKCAVVLTY